PVLHGPRPFAPPPSPGCAPPGEGREAIDQLANRGSPRAIDAAVARLEHVDAGVRAAAVQAVANVVGCDDVGAATAWVVLTPRLLDVSPRVRAAAVEVLCRRPPAASSAEVREAIESRIEDTDASVRLTAVGICRDHLRRGNAARMHPQERVREDAEAGSDRQANARRVSLSLPRGGLRSCAVTLLHV
ncbi:unnamed protein product, partial [Prorocentrum cordatum]